MSPRRRNDRNSPWSSKRSRSRSYSPGRRYRRSPRNDRRRSRSRDKYSKRDQSSSNYRNDFMSNKGVSSTRVPPPPPPTVHSISTATTYNPVPEPDYKNYGGYNQYNTMQTDYSQSTMSSQFSMSYPPPPSWNTAASETHVMAAPPPWPVVPPIPAPVHQVQSVQQIQPTKENNFENVTRDAAVAQEIQNQREELKKQRNDYLRKSQTMKKELKMLKEQMIELIGPGDAPPSPTTKGYIDENEKLQGQIQKKISTIENVLDMLNGIIGEEEEKEITPEKQKSESSESSASSSSSSSSSESDDDSSPERLKTKVIESMKSRKESQKLEEKKKEKRENNGVSAEVKFNFVFYDPEMNWCQVCNVFPKSAKDYLNHLHSKEHIDKVQVPPTPWHDDFRSDEFQHIGNAQVKRVPIRGLQFFVPSRSWFCKLCKVWMGDLHCASLHLKSRTHSSKYDEFFQKNLTYEVEWMAERQKALDTSNKFVTTTSIKIGQAENVFDNIPLKLGNLKNSEEKHSKSKKSESKKAKNKKKRSKKHKKGSSSSTSNSSSSENEAGAVTEDRASSIRVAMRNIKNPQDDLKDVLTSKGGYNPMDADEEKKKDDLIMTQWNTPQPIISESEKKLLEQLKGKLKNKPQDEPPKKDGETKKSNRDHIRRRGSITKDRSPISRNRSNRSRSRDRHRIRGDRRSRSINRYGRRSRSRERDRRSRSRDRERRSRSRRRNGSRGRSPYHWRGARRSISRDRRRWTASKSKSRSKSRSSSTSRRLSRIEKPSVRYPEFRPRISENESKRRSERERKLAGNIEEQDNERKKSPTSSSNSSSKKAATTTSSYAGGKKLPFIGRMPVLAKKQQEQTNENSNADLIDENSMNLMRDSKSMESAYAQYDNDGIYYDDLMPDPMQYASLMGAPPPPPPPMHVVDDKEILPPGIDEMETDFVPKPISEAPAPRKGPLPKDFEEALNIIFPGENKTDDKIDISSMEANPEIQNIEAPHTEIDSNIITETEVESNNDNINENTIEETLSDSIELQLQQIQMPPPTEITTTNEINIQTTIENEKQDEQSQNIANDISTDSVSKIVTEESLIDELSIALPEENVITTEKMQVEEEDIYFSTELKTSSESKVSSPSPVPNPKQKEWRPEELDDLAMLGIDADDLAAQCI